MKTFIIREGKVKKQGRYLDCFGEWVANQRDAWLTTYYYAKNTAHLYEGRHVKIVEKKTPCELRDEHC